MHRLATSLGLAATALTALLTAPAHAERTLSLDEALALARTESRDLKQARARLGRAATVVEAARTPLLPTVTAQGRYTHNYKDVDFPLAPFYQPTIGLAKTVEASVPSSVGAVSAYRGQLEAESAGAPIISLQKQEQLDLVVTATVPLVVPWAYPALDGAKQSYAASESTREATIANVLLATAQAFFGAAGADELVLARRNGVQLATEAAAHAERRFRAGSGQRVDVMRAQLARVHAGQGLAEALDVQGRAYRALATICQLREPFRVAPTEARGASDAAANVADHNLDESPEHDPDAARDALARRPELIALDRSLAARTASLQAQRLRFLPSLSAFGNLRAFNNRGFSGDLYSWGAGVEIDWLLYDAGARDVERHAARAERDELAAMRDSLRDAITDEAINARRTVATKRSALDAAASSLNLASETLRLVRTQHDEGVATVLELLAAQDALVGAEVALARARFDLALARLTLRHDLGQLR